MLDLRDKPWISVCLVILEVLIIVVAWMKNDDSRLKLLYVVEDKNHDRCFESLFERMTQWWCFWRCMNSGDCPEWLWLCYVIGRIIWLK